MEHEKHCNTCAASYFHDENDLYKQAQAAYKGGLTR